MDAALIYRARNRWLIWIAFACAVGIHLTAIVFAENKSKRPVAGIIPDSLDAPVIGIDEAPPMPQEEETITPSVPTENEFFEESVTPRPIRPRRKAPVPPVIQSIGSGIANQHGGSVKALTLFAPRPPYPYEARRAGVTGSGVAELTVNSASGIVVDARMSQSTGNAILDRATLETLCRWRFKSGVAPNVDVPITYTLTGVSY